MSQFKSNWKRSLPIISQITKDRITLAFTITILHEHFLTVVENQSGAKGYVRALKQAIMSLCNCRHRLYGKSKYTEDNMLESISAYIELELKEDDENEEDIQIGPSQSDSSMLRRCA